MISCNIPNEVVCGEPMSGTVTWTPESEKSPRKITLTFGWRTEGRGSTASEDVIICEHDPGVISARRPVEMPFEIQIPEEVPVSFNGELIRVIWSLKVRVDLPWAFDEKHEWEFRVLGRQVTA